MISKLIFLSQITDAHQNKYLHKCNIFFKCSAHSVLFFLSTYCILYVRYVVVAKWMSSVTSLVYEYSSGCWWSLLLWMGEIPNVKEQGKKKQPSDIDNWISFFLLFLFGSLFGRNGMALCLMCLWLMCLVSYYKAAMPAVYLLNLPFYVNYV